MSNLNPSAEAARENARNKNGQFGEQTRSEADTFSPPPPSAAWAFMGDGSLAGRPLMLRVQPQRWVGGDNLEDAGEQFEVDVSAVFAEMSDVDRAYVFDDPDDESGEDLYEKVFVRDGSLHDGPVEAWFEDRSVLGAWLDDNPVWREDGETPHPNGGYVRVLNDDGQVDYVNASGLNHRLDGPAIVRNFVDGDGYGVQSRAWLVDGVFHRTDGPADVSVRSNRDGTVNVAERWLVDGRFVGERNTTYSERVPGWEIGPGGVPKLVDAKARRDGPRRSWFTPPSSFN